MSRTAWLKILFIVTIANFVAQIPYYLHQYYFPSHLLPTFTGMALMLGVLAWFVGGFYLLYKQKRAGYILVVAFLTVEFLFYFMSQVSQLFSGHGILLYVLNPKDVLLFIVFGIGYINFITAAIFIYMLVKHRHRFMKA